MVGDDAATTGVIHEEDAAADVIDAAEVGVVVHEDGAPLYCPLMVLIWIFFFLVTRCAVDCVAAYGAASFASSLASMAAYGLACKEGRGRGGRGTAACGSGSRCCV